jgi:hypothetical protein
VGQIRPAKAEYPWVPGEVTVSQLRKLVVVVAGKVVADLAELLVDDREVVDEPFGRRCDRAFVLDGPRQQTVRVEQDVAVLGNAWMNGASTMGVVGDFLRCGKGRGVLLETLDTEEFSENRVLRLSRAPASAIAT